MSDKQIIAPRAAGWEFAFFASLPEIFAPHFHDYWVVGHLSGSLREARLQSGNFIIDENCLLLLNAEEAHSCRAMRAGGAWEALHIFPELLSRGNIRKERLFERPIAVSAVLIRDFRTLAGKIRLGNSVENASSNVEDFIEKLQDCQGSAFRGPDCCKDPASALTAVSSFGTQPSLEDMAQAAKMGKYRFLRFFTRHYGMPPHRYLVALRLGQARKLLARGIGLAEAAQLTGFYDQAHFTRSFKASMGYTPGEYRRFLGFHPQ